MSGQNTTTSPHGKISWTCTACHSADSWNKMKPNMTFDHRQTGFPLAGKHHQIGCRECHRDLQFSNIGIACIDCHSDVHSGRLGNKCERCHSPANWSSQENAFSLHQARGFLLSGMHQLIDCEACHTRPPGQEFSGTPVTCHGCHQADYASSQNPNHALAQFDLACQKCHLQPAVRWDQAIYQHTASFPIRGAHQNLDCNSCHSTTFRGMSHECFACHQAQFTQAQNPSHVIAGFPENCAICHTENDWQPASFDHASATGFALTGAHQTATCTSCHVNNQFKGLPRDCFGCHAVDFNSVGNPNHQANQFSHDCLWCHNNVAWSPAMFDHNSTNFPLTGAHQTVQCVSCHQTGYAGTPWDCFSCHAEQYNATTDPNHQANQFSHECLTCHSNVAWSPAIFDHSKTSFPLTGAHQTVQCVSCHQTGYAGTPQDCFSCHAEQYNATTDPNHQANQFSHDCLTCHSNVSWSPATFDHNNTAFPLTGAHQTAQCAACHQSGYAGTAKDCYACHRSEYDQTTDPNHAAAGFPTTCQNCHNTSDWHESSWDHDAQYFPINSGAHRDKWTSCADCHQNPNNFSVFSCINCHEHSKTLMDDQHREVRNYIYDSAACYSCHPRGRADAI